MRAMRWMAFGRSPARRRTDAMKCRRLTPIRLWMSATVPPRPDARASMASRHGSRSSDRGARGANHANTRSRARSGSSWARSPWTRAAASPNCEGTSATGTNPIRQLFDRALQAGCQPARRKDDTHRVGLPGRLVQDGPLVGALKPDSRAFRTGGQLIRRRHAQRRTQHDEEHRRRRGQDPLPSVRRRPTGIPHPLDEPVHGRTRHPHTEVELRRNHGKPTVPDPPTRAPTPAPRAPYPAPRPPRAAPGSASP